MMQSLIRSSARWLAALGFIALVGTGATSLHAQERDVSPEKLKLAAKEYDAGRRSFQLEQFRTAANHFENAFRDAPSPQALRLAIISWEKAGNLARAATLAARAQGLYPDDERTLKLTQDVLGRVRKKLGKVIVSCEPACTLSLDGRLVDERELADTVFYAVPGEHVLQSGWSHGRMRSKHFNAKAGGSLTLSFKAPPIPKEPEEKGDAHGSTGKGSVNIDTGTRGSGKASPLLFWLGTGAVAVVGGITVWSGIDTLNNPGPDEVEKACVGKGTGCPEYQDGLAKQRRTNYLLAGTVVGAASVAVIGLFFTDWGNDDRDQRATAVVPTVDAAGGLGLSATGRF